MGVALAGVEAGREKFNNQLGILDELLRPKGWNSAGLTVVGSIPDAWNFIINFMARKLIMGILN